MMAALESRSFDELVQQFLGSPLPARIDGNCGSAKLPDETRIIAERMLALMQRASCPATELNEQMVWMISKATPAMLPSAWGGRIPPLTAPGRHRKLDAYVRRQKWSDDPGDKEQPVFVDLGCGFPPATTVDTANALKEWSVMGLDRSFASYVLFDPQGDYACFNKHGAFLYFQPVKKPLHENPVAARERFEALFAELAPDLGDWDNNGSSTVEKDGNRLIRNHIRDFETPNLRFVEADITDLSLGPARVIRCMNVLLYFTKSTRRKMRQSLLAKLEQGGLMISGFNHPFGGYVRYTVRKRDRSEIRPCEFAFSPDNLRPLGIGPWVTIVDEDEDAGLLADLTGAIRRDRRFWDQFNPHVDELRTEYGIGARDKDGFFRFSEEVQTAPPALLMQKTSALWDRIEKEGYVDGAVAALQRAGYQAWKNAVGHVAVLPPEGSMPAD
ncbi:MAG: CheR family methyltransferase [Desulfosarcinaceae bacterium]